MKVPVLISALLISFNPAQAEAFIYLQCAYKINTSTKDLKTNQVSEESKTDNINYKVDTANSRIQASNEPQWEEVNIVDGIAVGQMEDVSAGLTMRVKYSIDIAPPGDMSIDMRRSNTKESTSIKVKGVCQKSDQASFNKASTFGDH